MTTRRRFLTILAGSALLPIIGAHASTQTKQWQGIALGAKAQIILDHPDAEQLIALAVSEVHRLEKVFSLFKSDSELSKLNRDGMLQEPAFELVELLSICSRLHAVTSGAFDPTVQSLWSLYARQFSNGLSPTEAQILTARAQTGWAHVEYSAEQISFRQPGIAMTLNGIAQGFIADKVTTLFKQHGVSNVLVDTGEIVALGSSPEGLPWQVKLANSNGAVMPLRDAAIATSAPLGTTFNAGGTVGHIIDPRTGYPGGEWSQVSVVSHSAADADGLSTAFCLMNRSQIDAAKGSNEVFLQS